MWELIFDSLGIAAIIYVTMNNAKLRERTKQLEARLGDR